MDVVGDVASAMVPDSIKEAGEKAIVKFLQTDVGQATAEKAIEINKAYREATTEKERLLIESAANIVFGMTPSKPVWRNLMKSLDKKYGTGLRQKAQDVSDAFKDIGNARNLNSVEKGILYRLVPKDLSGKGKIDVDLDSYLHNTNYTGTVEEKRVTEVLMNLDPKFSKRYKAPKTAGEVFDSGKVTEGGFGYADKISNAENLGRVQRAIDATDAEVTAILKNSPTKINLDDIVPMVERNKKGLLGTDGWTLLTPSAKQVANERVQLLGNIAKEMKRENGGNPIVSADKMLELRRRWDKLGKKTKIASPDAIDGKAVSDHYIRGLLNDEIHAMGGQSSKTKELMQNFSALLTAKERLRLAQKGEGKTSLTRMLNRQKDGGVVTPRSPYAMYATAAVIANTLGVLSGGTLGAGLVGGTTYGVYKAWKAMNKKQRHYTAGKILAQMSEAFTKDPSKKTKAVMEAFKADRALIKEMATDEFWEDVTDEQIEALREDETSDSDAELGR